MSGKPNKELQHGRRRVAIENVNPEVDGGRFPVKRVVGDILTVEADAFADGHEEIQVVLSWCEDDCREWHEVEMEPLGNDRWRASFALEKIGRYEYTISAWIDRYGTWEHDLEKRVAAGQDVTVDLQIGAELVKDERTHVSTLERPRSVVVDPRRAGFSAWYELFPRSASPDPKRHGTFHDVVERLDYVAELGFDVLYLPPIHPIGRQFRKGANNEPSTDAGDPGVPWAIGGTTGGHTAILPDLGDFAGFTRLVHEARRRGIEIALDIAFQASPDHPWVTEHPDWFRHRPDGTIQYAENPPKKYQDIYPFDFESDDWRGLWAGLADVFRFWIGQGVTLFRVDNPHTKSFAFWEWAINDIKRDHPEVLFLAEAFTRPKLMYRLAKLGFSQSYTYFTWRNSAAELREYMEELTSPSVSDFFRPSFWPNTPDILHADLQAGGRAAFEARFVLASTLSSNYGIYGPAFELGEAKPREPGSEEYLDSEKYQQRKWDLDAPHSLRDLITRVNRARREHPALQSNERLTFHEIDNPNLLAYTKHSADGSDVVLVVANFDFQNSQVGLLELDLELLGLPLDRPYEVVDLLDDTTVAWTGPVGPIELDPRDRGAHVLWLKA